MKYISPSGVNVQVTNERSSMPSQLLSTPPSPKHLKLAGSRNFQNAKDVQYSSKSLKKKNALNKLQFIINCLDNNKHHSHYQNHFADIQLSGTK